MGMFCRLGLVLERRPVAVPTWLKVVWMRPSESASCGQRVEVGALELLELAVLDDEGGDGVVLGELFEDVLRGGDDFALAVLHRLGQAHLVEEDVAELLGGVDVEAVAGVGVDALGEVVDRRRRGGEDMLAEEGGVDADAGLLHAQEDGDEGEVDGRVDVRASGEVAFGVAGLTRRGEEHLGGDGAAEAGSSLGMWCSKVPASASCVASAAARRTMAAAASGRRLGSAGLALVG